jgi:hypothetical protein
MARPPRQIFQKLKIKNTEIKEKLKKDIIKYFLLIYLITELFSFALEHFNPVFYLDFGFNLITQLQFLVLFVFLLRFNFCKRNKIIIYVLLIYFAFNAFLPFLITNEFYVSIFKNIFVILLNVLLILTIKKNEE